MKIEFTSETETREYAVEKRIELTDFQNSNTNISTITEELSITFEHSNPLGIIAKVKISNVKKDGKRSFDNPIEHYFHKTGEVLNNLTLRLSPDGKIEKIENHDEVKKNWEYIKIYLDNYFVSDDENVLSTLKGWTAQSDAIVKDEKQLMNLIELDLFYNRFFYGYWKDYSKPQTEEHSFPGIFGKANTVLNEKIVATEDDTSKKLNTTGYLNKEASDMEAIAESLGVEESQMSDLDVSLKATYQFDSVGIIENIELKAETTMAETDFKRSYSLTVRKRD